MNSMLTLLEESIQNINMYPCASLTVLIILCLNTLLHILCLFAILLKAEYRIIFLEWLSSVEHWLKTIGTFYIKIWLESENVVGTKKVERAGHSALITLSFHWASFFWLDNASPLTFKRKTPLTKLILRNESYWKYRYKFVSCSSYQFSFETSLFTYLLVLWSPALNHNLKTSLRFCCTPA